jgi:phosphinothricin acetyltransferase
MKMEPMLIRRATDADLDAILAIHNQAIKTSLAIWTDDPVDRADREAWFAIHAAAGWPIFVAEIDGDVAGYASYSSWRERWGYRKTVENSVYIADSFHRRGIGRALLLKVIDHARAAGMHAMIADIEADNTASIALHESLSFVREGTIREVGTKFGRWLDLAILRLPLD